MTSLAQPVLSKPNGLDSLSPHSHPRSPEDVRFQVISDYLHDLRSPLVALRGYSRMVLEERAGSLNSAQKEYLGIVVENTNRVVRVLNELAQVAALEPLSFRLVDARELIRVFLLRWRPRLLSRSIQLREALPPESCFLRGDYKKLGEAFDDLFCRLAESANPGAEIVVEMSRSEAQIQIRISGGLETAWDVLPSTGTSASTSPGDRAGGMSLAESVIRLHGGHMEAGNDSGSSASLTVVVPACSGGEFPERESHQ
jgi:signal transduction histidine kinase